METFKILKMESGDWKYRVGEQTVTIFSPDATRYCPDISQVLNLDWAAIDVWNAPASYKVTEISIREWIERNALSGVGNPAPNSWPAPEVPLPAAHQGSPFQQFSADR